MWAALRPVVADVWRRQDPRLYQIAALAGLFGYGFVWLDFPVSGVQVAVLLGTVLLTQAVCSRLWQLPTYDPRSALISGLSLCLLLRTNSLSLAMLTAVITIGSKFVLRWRGKHLFNPTNFGIIAMMLATQQVWASPGQWGSTAFFALLMACLGGLVVYRATRSDVTCAFLICHIALRLGRAWRLGDPLDIPLHQLQNGALVLFAFFMISDPKTTPNTRLGRMLFAGLVALVAWYMQFVWYWNDALLWSLACCSLIVPLFDWLLPGPQYAWPHTRGTAIHATYTHASPLLHDCVGGEREQKEVHMLSYRLLCTVLLLSIACCARVALGFCGFYVAKADTQLFNKASKVALVRHDDKTVLTMANDYRGDPQEFALVVPVPTFLERDQIHVGDPALIDHLDAYSAPRLVEYFDENPCRPRPAPAFGALAGRAQQAPAATDTSLGVTVEARYTVGEYDIVLLSAEQSTGLETWLRANGYRLPSGAAPVLGSYIRQGMRFFVARVNLKEQARLGFSYLRPLQIAFESPKFMLPIRLGTVNADGPQELYVFALTRKGRVETTNYRTVKLPADMDLPVFIKHEFGQFYRAMFDQQVQRTEMRAVFLEYAWDMGWCDPCAADPLSAQELRQLGVFWLAEAPVPQRPRRPPAQGQEVFITRLHLRYDAAHFPEDLVFQETADRTNFQGRYVLRHPWQGSDTCQQAQTYRAGLPQRWEREAQALATLTGWPIEAIRQKMPGNGTLSEPHKWWQKLWKE